EPHQTAPTFGGRKSAVCSNNAATVCSSGDINQSVAVTCCRMTDIFKTVAVIGTPNTLTTWIEFDQESIKAGIARGVSAVSRLMTSRGCYRVSVGAACNANYIHKAVSIGCYIINLFVQVAAVVSSPGPNTIPVEFCKKPILGPATIGILMRSKSRQVVKPCSQS